MGVTFRIKGVYKGVDPERCYREICDIGEKATAKQIVNAARDEGSELHKCFEWDDSKAAEKWREEQARNLVRLLVFTKDDETKEPTKLRVMHIAEEPHAYMPTELILRNKDEYAALLNRAISELRAFQDKYKTLSELEEVFNAIDAL